MRSRSKHRKTFAASRKLYAHRLQCHRVYRKNTLSTGVNSSRKLDSFAEMKPLFSIILALLTIGAVKAQDRPNIIYILSDDMGFSDIGCYGSEIETPNLDALAEGGLRFTQFYNTARCCPTRASLITGLYPHQAGIGHMVDDRGQDGYRGELNRECVTIPEVLGTAGYRSYLSGKWHVTSEISGKDGTRFNWPLQRGFDRFYGTIHGAGSFFDPNTLTRGNEFISPLADPEYPLDLEKGGRDGAYYYTDAISDHAVKFITDHHVETGDQPFFLYVSYTAAHWPMHALPEDIAKYAGKYDVGFEAIRKARHAKMIELGLLDSAWEVAPMQGSSWDEVKEKELVAFEARCMEVYAAMIDNMDQGVGRIVESLKATGQDGNTLICFFQDNGGCAELFGRRPNQVATQRAEVATLEPLSDDSLQPDMEPKQTRDGFPVRRGIGVLPGPSDTYVAYGQAWATVSNTPFREYKHWTHEGGISTPLIVNWPDGITERHGELIDTPSHLIDLMATAVELSGAEYPKTFHGGKSIKPMEGKSLVPVFKGTGGIERDALYWEHEGNRAIRVGDMKLVWKKSGKAKWELYDLKADRTEQHDLAAEMPEQVEALAAKWQTYAERANVIPWPEKKQKKH